MLTKCLDPTFFTRTSPFSPLYREALEEIAAETAHYEKLREQLDLVLIRLRNEVDLKEDDPETIQAVLRDPDGFGEGRGRYDWVEVVTIKSEVRQDRRHRELEEDDQQQQQEISGGGFGPPVPHAEPNLPSPGVTPGGPDPVRFLPRPVCELWGATGSAPTLTAKGYLEENPTLGPQGDRWGFSNIPPNPELKRHYRFSFRDQPNPGNNLWELMKPYVRALNLADMHRTDFPQRVGRYGQELDTSNGTFDQGIGTGMLNFQGVPVDFFMPVTLYIIEYTAGNAAQSQVKQPFFYNPATNTNNCNFFQ